MSRQFQEGVAGHLELTSGLPTIGYPFTIAFWMYAPNNDLNQATGFYTNNNSQSIAEILSTEKVIWSNWNGSSWAQTSSQGNSFTNNTWSHVAIVMTSTTDWRVVLNGDWANSGTYTSTARTTGQPSEIRIGDGTSNLSARMEGLIAHYAIWSVALSQSEVEGLAGPFSSGSQSGSGDNPLAVQNANLLLYIQIDGTSSPEPDAKNNYDFTVSGSPPAGGSNPSVDSPPGGGASVAVFAHHYRMQGIQ